MVTAWSLPDVLRLRPSAGARRLVLVAMLLFGVVYAHGVSSDGVAHHVASVGTTASAMAASDGAETGPESVAEATYTATSDAAGHHEDGEETAHPGQECVPGQPMQGPTLGAPCVSVWPGGDTAFDQLRLAPMWVEVASAPPPLTDSTGSGVLRI